MYAHTHTETATHIMDRAAGPPPALHYTPGLSKGCVNVAETCKARQSASLRELREHSPTPGNV